MVGHRSRSSPLRLRKRLWGFVSETGFDSQKATTSLSRVFAMKKKVVKFPKKAARVRSAIQGKAKDLNSDCKAYAEAGMQLITELKSGRLDRDDAKVAAQTLGHIVKSANVRVQDKHAHQNLVKQSILVAARDDDKPGTVDKVIRSAKALRDLNPNEMKQAISAA